MRDVITPGRARELDKLASQLFLQMPVDISEFLYLTDCLSQVGQRWVDDERAGAVAASRPIISTLHPHLQLVASNASA